MKQNLVKGKRTVKKTAAWLLSICMVLTGFIGNVFAGNVHAADSEPATDEAVGEAGDPSVLMAKEWLNYDDNGELIMTEDNQPGHYPDETEQITEIEDTTLKQVELPGESLWINLVTYADIEEWEVKEKKSIVFSSALTMDYYGKTFPMNEGAEVIEHANDTIKKNADNENLIDFTPKKTGYYLLSYQDVDFPLVLSVTYPELAFYKEPERTLENLQARGYESNCCDYAYNQEAEENIIYLNLYKENLQEENYSTISLSSGTPEEKEKNEEVLTPFEFRYEKRGPENKEIIMYGDDTGINGYISVEKLPDNKEIDKKEIDKIDHKENSSIDSNTDSNTDCWYKITFTTPLTAQDYYGEEIYLESVNLHVNAEKTDYWYDDYKENEETGEWIPVPDSKRSETYIIDGWLDAACYDYSDIRYGLVVKDWIDYNENGDMILADDGTPGFYDEENNNKLVPIPENDNKNVCFPKDTLWIDYVTLIDGERMHITADDLSVTYYGEKDPYNVSNEDAEKPKTGNADKTIKANPDYSELIDFTPEGQGYYLFSGKELKKPLIVYVDYPNIAFYKNTEMSKDNLVYTDGGSRYSYYRGKTENSIYFYLYSKENNDWNQKITLASGDPKEENEDETPFVFRFWDSEGREDIRYGNTEGIEDYFSVKKVDGKEGWYQIIFDESLKNDNADINNFELRINAKVEEEWIGEDGEIADRNQYETSSWLHAQCYNSGLYAATIEWPNDFSTEMGADINPGSAVILLKNILIEDGKETETILSDPSKIKVFILEENEGEENEGKDQWSGEPVDKDYVEYSAYSENSDYLQFIFYREGTYGITDGSNYITIYAYLPSLGFYTEPERPDDGRKIETLINKYYEVLEGQEDKFYMVTWFDETNPDSPDIDSIKILAYDEKNNDISDKYINYSKKIYNEENRQIGYEVQLLKEVSSNFKIIVSGKTISHITEEGGNQQPVEPYELENEIWIYCAKITSIEITTPPSKTVYTEGEKFDASGMIVTAVYDNGDKKEISYEDYKLSIEDVLSTDDTEVIITYRDKTANQKLTVNAKKVPENPSQNNPVVTPGSSSVPSSPTQNTSGSSSSITEVSDKNKGEDNTNDNTNTPDNVTSEVPNKTEIPEQTQNPDDHKDNNENPSKTDKPIKVGDSVKDSKTGAYKITKMKKDGTPVIVYTPNKAAKKASSITIKSSVKINGKKYKVTKIAANAFKNCSKLKKIVIPSSITTIGSSAFKGCLSLKKITINSSKIKSMGKDSFKNISKKAVIKVPKAKKAAYKKLLKKSGYTGTIQ